MQPTIYTYLCQNKELDRNWKIKETSLCLSSPVTSLSGCLHLDKTPHLDRSIQFLIDYYGNYSLDQSMKSSQSDLLMTWDRPLIRPLINSIYHHKSDCHSGMWSHSANPNCCCQSTHSPSWIMAASVLVVPQQTQHQLSEIHNNNSNLEYTLLR